MHTLIRLKSLSLTLLLAAWAGASPAQPSDIDIYRGVQSQDLPNVLLLLDASANWNPSVGATCSFQDGGVPNGQPTDQGSKYANELCALYNVVDRLPLASDGAALFNVGLMLSNANPSSNKGGYPLHAFVPLNAAGKSSLKAAIRGITNTPAFKANQPTLALMMHEAYLYFKGLPPRVGHLNTLWDSRAVAYGKYVTPATNSCGRNYVIFIANGGPNSGEGGEAFALLRDLGGLAAVSPIADPNLGSYEASWADEYARFMRNAGISDQDAAQGIVTHGVAVVDSSSTPNQPERQFRNFVRSMANHGGGNYYEASDSEVLVESLLAVFNQIQAADSVFASASLPVSVNARGTFDNQIFMGMFRPDAQGKPRWRGNLKQYQFGLDAGNNLFLADAAGKPAISASSGFITPSATSFWTLPSEFWTAEPMGTPLSTSDAPDGEVVEKGSVAQWLRTTFASSQAGRKVYTCIGCSSAVKILGSADTLFSAANGAITAASLGVASADEREKLIDWVRGENNSGKEPGPTTVPATTVRPSIHGDVLHSRPAVVSYGGSTGVVVFYGANDGQLRAVTGTQGSGGGQELWSFVPEEHLSKLSRLRSNAPEIRLSTTPAGVTAEPRDYFVDGPIGVYLKYTSGTLEKAWLYVAMRRGGRWLYAFDVSVPTAPRFMWKVTPVSAGMSLLGQTWSEPRAARLKGLDDPVLVFGGGYDAGAEDSAADTTMGNAVFVLNGRTGELLRAFTGLDATASAQSIDRSVAADVTLVDIDHDRLVDRAYAADLGGQIYRIDFEGEGGTELGPDEWTIHKIADLSGGTSTGRKFFYGPDVIPTKDFVALMIGSGDREKPLHTATQDHFFQIFDRRVSKGAPPLSESVSWSGLTEMTQTPNLPSNGCYLALAQGEKVVNAATSIGGRSYFGTNRPSTESSTACSVNLGVAKTYEMPLFCVAATGQVIAGGGLPPSPVSGIVNVKKADGTVVQVPFIIGAPNARGSAIEGSRVQPVIEAPRTRRYWFQETRR